MVLVADLLDLAKEIHIVNAAEFVLVEEPHESLQVGLRLVLAQFDKHVEEFLGGDKTDI